MSPISSSLDGIVKGEHQPSAPAGRCVGPGRERARCREYLVNQTEVGGIAWGPHCFLAVGKCIASTWMQAHYLHFKPYLTFQLCRTWLLKGGSAR